LLCRAHYRQLDSLLEHVLIEPERGSIHLFRRNADGNWVFHPLAGDAELDLTSVDFRCLQDALNEDVDLP
jgi:hypothetical protein